MAFFEQLIGFSTGAIAKDDFRRALRLLKSANVPAVELSALREHELPALSQSLSGLDLTEFAYVAVHAPTRFAEFTEIEVVHLLQTAVSLQLPIVVHPDTIKTPNLWRPFGPLLLVENMDKRKTIGRTAAELKSVFDALPEAGFCFDIAHARQVDPSMIESAAMLREFRGRLREVHASGVTTRSIHCSISAAAGSAFSTIAHLIPETVPILLESPVSEAMIWEEIGFARTAFSPWLERLRSDIDDVLDLKIETLRRIQAESFLKILQVTHVKLSDFEDVIRHLPPGGPFSPGSAFLSARDLLGKLSDEQKVHLREYLLYRIKELSREYPDLRSEYYEQFANIE